MSDQRAEAAPIVCPSCGTQYVEQRYPTRLRAVNETEWRGEGEAVAFVHPVTVECRLNPHVGGG